MANVGDRISPRQRVFARHYASTGDAVYAATKAGYGTPAARASQNLANPTLMAEARKLTLQRLTNDVLPLAVDRHLALLQDPETKGPTLTKAIEIAYKHGLAERDAGDDKPLHEMTAGELADRVERGRVLIEALERERVERAKIVIEAEATYSDEDAPPVRADGHRLFE